MDAASYEQILSFWPDVARPFSRVVPDGCYLVRTEDDWTEGQGATRTRTIDLARGSACPAIEQLIEEAKEDAERIGWTIVDEDTTDEEVVLELESVLCRIHAATVRVFGGAARALRVAFHQPWPPDAGAPVETSEMFQNLVRKLLKLPGSPERLVKEVTLDGLPDTAFQVDRLRERVVIANDPQLLRRLEMIGFSLAQDGTWRSAATIAPPFEITAEVEASGDRVVIEMTKVRIRN
jgi:hypothetical protein